MRIEFTERCDVLVVKIRGSRLDSVAADEFRHAMDGCTRAGDGKVVLDVSDVEFIDSAGLGAIVTTRKRLGRHRNLVICGARTTVTRVFELARLDRFLPIAADEEEALALLSP